MKFCTAFEKFRSLFKKPYFNCWLHKLLGWRIATDNSPHTLDSFLIQFVQLLFVWHISQNKFNIFRIFSQSEKHTYDAANMMSSWPAASTRRCLLPVNGTPAMFTHRRPVLFFLIFTHHCVGILIFTTFINKKNTCGWQLSQMQTVGIWGRCHPDEMQLSSSLKKNSFPSFPKSSSSTHPCYHWHHPHWEAVLDDYLLNHFTLEVGICRPAAAEYLREEKCLQLNFCLLCVYLTNTLCCCQWGRVGKYSVAKSWNWNTSNAILS